MAVIYKVYSMHANPTDKKSPKLFFPRAVTLGRSVQLDYIIDKIKDRSSLSGGDVKSVLTNFIEKLKEQLLEGKSVNIEGLGVFRVSLRAKGAEKATDVSARSVETVRVCFKAHKDLKINKNETRAGDKLSLISIDDYMGVFNSDQDEMTELDTDIDTEDATNQENGGKHEEGGNLEPNKGTGSDSSSNL